MLSRLHQGNFTFMPSGGRLTIINNSKNTRKTIDLPGKVTVMDYYNGFVFFICEIDGEKHMMEFKITSGFRITLLKYLDDPDHSHKKTKEILNFKE